jgi:hypothetical protein
MRTPVNKPFVRSPYSDEQVATLARRLPHGAEFHLDLRDVDGMGSAAVAALLGLYLGVGDQGWASETRFWQPPGAKSGARLRYLFARTG